MTLSRPMMPLSGAASLLRVVRAPVDFAVVLLPLDVFVVTVLVADVVVTTLSEGPALTAGTVDDAAAVVSALDCPDFAHATITPDNATTHTCSNLVITGSLRLTSWLPSAVGAARVSAPDAPTRPALTSVLCRPRGS